MSSKDLQYELNRSVTMMKVALVLVFVLFLNVYTDAFLGGVRANGKRGLLRKVSSFYNIRDLSTKYDFFRD